MAKRRRHWGRIILGYCCLFLTMLCAGMMITVAVLNDNGRVNNKFAEEMKDTTPPVIEMRGGEQMTIAVGDSLEEPGIMVYDESSLPEVKIESNVDVSRAGEYKICYDASDEAGNTTTAERNVKVIQPAGRIYLTFDDGPSEYTSTLLDVLNKYGVKVTFFVTGYGDDEVLKREYDEGHAIGLHTLSHNYSYLYANLDNYWADLDAVQDRVQRVTGQKTFLMRFPGGSSNLVSAIYDGGIKIMSSLVDDVSNHGYTYFDWNVDSDDAGKASTPDEVYGNVTRVLGDGGEYVVLQHDVKPYSVEAVERIIQYGLERGFVFSKLREGSFAAHHGVNN